MRLLRHCCCCCFNCCHMPKAKQRNRLDTAADGVSLSLEMVARVRWKESITDSCVLVMCVSLSHRLLLLLLPSPGTTLETERPLPPPTNKLRCTALYLLSSSPMTAECLQLVDLEKPFLIRLWCARRGWFQPNRSSIPPAPAVYNLHMSMKYGQLLTHFFPIQLPPPMRFFSGISLGEKNCRLPHVSYEERNHIEAARALFNCGCIKIFNEKKSS